MPLAFKKTVNIRQFDNGNMTIDSIVDRYVVALLLSVLASALVFKRLKRNPNMSGEQITAVREAHRIDENRLAEYLSQNMENFGPNIQVQQFEGGLKENSAVYFWEIIRKSVNHQIVDTGEEYNLIDLGTKQNVPHQLLGRSLSHATKIEPGHVWITIQVASYGAVVARGAGAKSSRPTA